MQQAFILLQQSSLDTILSSDLLKLLSGVLIGISPMLYNFIKDKIRWPSEQTVMQGQGEVYRTEAVENIVQAASLLLEQSHKLNEKNTRLIDVYEATLERQDVVLQDEIKLRLQQEREIAGLKEQVTAITGMMMECSREIVSIIKEMQNGTEVKLERLHALENKWNDVHMG